MFLFFLQTTSRCSSLRTWTRSYPTSFQGTRSLSSDILHSFTHAHSQHFLVRDQVFQLLGVRCLRQSEILMAYINRSIIPSFATTPRCGSGRKIAKRRGFVNSKLTDYSPGGITRSRDETPHRLGNYCSQVSRIRSLPKAGFMEASFSFGLSL